MNEKEQRELDAWIAENVFGLTKHRIDYTSDNHAIFETMWLPPSCPPTAPYDQIQKECEVSIPNYTTDPAAAMEVLKKCMTVTAVVLGTEKDNIISCGSSSGIYESSEAETLELAICLFAQKIWSK